MLLLVVQMDGGKQAGKPKTCDQPIKHKDKCKFTEGGCKETDTYFIYRKIQLNICFGKSLFGYFISFVKISLGQ